MTTDMQLEELFGDALPASQAGWRRYGFVENPFPSRSHPVWEVFHNQELLRRRFYSDLKVFVREGITTTMFFTGGNRIGKTHFCEHHRITIPASLSSHDLIVPIAFVSAESSKFTELYRPIVDQIEDSLRVQTGQGLFASSWRERLPEITDALPPGQFRQAVISLTDTTTDADFITMRSLLMQWLRGERIRLPQRRLLGVTSPIESLADQLNALQGLIVTLRNVEVDSKQSPGIVLFVDEFELIWTHRRDQRDRFLHALRALIDACPMGLLLCVAMATGTGYQYGPDDVEREYPAFFARLKGAREVPALVEIPGVIEAQEYARAFLNHARAKAEKANVPAGPDLFTDADLRAMFIEVAGGRGGSASQGDYFDRLHTKAEELVARQ